MAPLNVGETVRIPTSRGLGVVYSSLEGSMAAAGGEGGHGGEDDVDGDDGLDGGDRWRIALGQWLVVRDAEARPNAARADQNG